MVHESVAVFTIRSCQLVSDQLWTLIGSAADIARTFIRLLEGGGRSPALRTLLRLAEYLGVKPSDLLRRMESKVAGVDRAAHWTAAIPHRNPH